MSGTRKAGDALSKEFDGTPGHWSQGGNESSANNGPRRAGTAITDSFSSEGGTLTNSGNLEAGGNISLDNSVTNKNTVNRFEGDNRSFTYNSPSLNSSEGNISSNGGGDQAGKGYPTMNSYDDDALNQTPVSSATLANFQRSGGGSGSEKKNAALTDTPVSAATMAGFYKPSDSPAAAAKRVAQYVTINNSNQEKYADVGTNTSSKYIEAARKANRINTSAIDANLNAGIERSRAESDLLLADTFGDIWNYQAPEFKAPGQFNKPEAPDFEKISDDIYDRIEG